LYLKKNHRKDFVMKKIALALLAVFGVVGGSAIAQFWGNLPTIGGSSFCSSTVNSNCVNTVAAGPALTGNETIPADTNASGGQSPQTAKFPLSTLGIGPTQFAVPLNGTVITMLPISRRVIFEPAGTIATATLLMPPVGVLADNQIVAFCTTQIVTTMTVTAGSGTTVNGPPTAMLVPVTTGGASCPEWVYRLSNTTWYRVH